MLRLSETRRFLQSSSFWEFRISEYSIINEAFVASSGDIITDYNDLDCLFTRRIASRLVNITMSAFVIGETTNNKHYSTLLKTRVWIVSGKFFKYENILTECKS